MRIKIDEVEIKISKDKILAYKNDKFWLEMDANKDINAMIFSYLIEKITEIDEKLQNFDKSKKIKK